MKKRLLALAFAMTMLLASCGDAGNASASGTSPSETPADSADEAAADAGDSEQADEGEAPPAGETTHIRWAQGTSGNGLVTVGNRMGYFEEVGLTVEEVPMENDAFIALAAGQIDIISNDGTNGPLQQIAAGEPITIFGGHMLTGCMPVIAKAGTEWNGVEDFVGKKVATPPTQFAVTGALLDLGYDPLEEVEWLTLPTQSDRVAAVISGEADYGVIGTGQMYGILNMDEVEILCYMSDITPNYSCCRMETRTSFIEENPTTTKLLLKALLRAQSYYEANKEEVVGWMAEELGTTEEYVAAYMLNEDYRINVDPIKNPVIRAWNYLDATGFLDENAKTIDVEDHINIDLYKAALDEAVAEYGDESPAFYERMVAFYEENNL